MTVPLTELYSFKTTLSDLEYISKSQQCKMVPTGKFHFYFPIKFKICRIVKDVKEIMHVTLTYI